MVISPVLFLISTKQLTSERQDRFRFYRTQRQNLSETALGNGLQRHRKNSSRLAVKNSVKI